MTYYHLNKRLQRFYAAVGEEIEAAQDVDLETVLHSQAKEEAKLVLLTALDDLNNVRRWGADPETIQVLGLAETYLNVALNRLGYLSNGGAPEVAREPTLCKWCGKGMVKGGGCSIEYVSLPVGSTTRVFARSAYHFNESNGNCHDCGVRHGNIHHYGCDVERCPLCKEQFITCGHFDAAKNWRIINR